MKKKRFFQRNSCVYQKKVVPLHPNYKFGAVWPLETGIYIG